MIGRRASKRLAVTLVVAIAAVYGTDWSLARAAESSNGSTSTRAFAGQTTGAAKPVISRSAQVRPTGAITAPWAKSGVVQQPRAVPQRTASQTGVRQQRSTTSGSATQQSAGKKINNTELDFEGNWDYISDDSLSQGKFQKDSTFSETAGDTATFEFTGSSLTLVTTLDAHHGMLSVSVDGGPEKTVDLYAPKRTFQDPVYSTGKLEPGNHTVTFRVLGKANTSSTGNVITIDRVDVFA